MNDCVSRSKWRTLCQRLYSLLWCENVSNDISGNAETGSNNTCNQDCRGEKRNKKLLWINWTLKRLYWTTDILKSPGKKWTQEMYLFIYFIMFQMDVSIVRSSLWLKTVVYASKLRTFWLLQLTWNIKFDYRMLPFVGRVLSDSVGQKLNSRTRQQNIMTQIIAPITPSTSQYHF